MKHKLMQVTCYFVLSLESLSASSFELKTHGVLTNQAYSVSTLGTSSNLLRQLGLVDLPSPLDNSYYDFSGAVVNKRTANTYEASKRVNRVKG
jgi:hypothetical protein